MKIHQQWNCTCGFEFKSEDGNPDCPIEQIKEIVLRAHQDDGHQLTHIDLQDAVETDK